MFIAHLPAGYLLHRLACRTHSRAVLWAALIGSIFPDFDVLYFYLWDARRHHHHTYWIHIPYYWILYGGIALVLIRQWRRSWFPAAAFFVAAVLLHLILDTFVGGIAWAYPLTSQLYFLHQIAPKYEWWVWNFILDWTFLAEILIIGIAARAYLPSRLAVMRSRG